MNNQLNQARPYNIQNDTFGRVGLASPGAKEDLANTPAERAAAAAAAAAGRSRPL